VWNQTTQSELVAKPFVQGHLATRNQVILSLTWIPLEFNVTADGLSKFHDRGDCVFTGDAFQALSNRWGPFTFHLFAAAQLPHPAVF
jgi:hypothetical protein